MSCFRRLANLLVVIGMFLFASWITVHWVFADFDTLEEPGVSLRAEQGGVPVGYPPLSQSALDALNSVPTTADPMAQAAASTLPAATSQAVMVREATPMDQADMQATPLTGGGLVGDVASGEEGDADDANEDPEEAEAMDVNLQLAGEPAASPAEDEEEPEANDTPEAEGGPGAPTAKDRRSSQTKLLRSLSKRLVVSKDAHPTPEGAVAAEPAEFAAQSQKPFDAWAKKPKIVSKTFVFQSRAGLAYGHMSTVARLPAPAPFRWMVAWQASHHIEGTDGQHIRAAFSDDGAQWSKSLQLPVGQHLGAQAVWSPVLFSNQGFVYLFYSESINCLRPKRGNRPPRWSPGGDIFMSRSGDGVTWSAPKTIYKQSDEGGIPKVIANPPDVVDNKWVLPFWREKPPAVACKSASQAGSAGVLVSSDGAGAKWKPFGAMRMRGSWLIEGGVARRPNSDLLQLFRTKKGEIYQAASPDGGTSWSTVTSLGLPNPNSKLAVLRLSTGELALCYNDSPSSRNRLRVALSSDGHAWRNIADLEVPGRARMTFSYPTMAQDGDTLIVTYSVWRKSNSIKIDETGIRAVVIQLPKPDVAGVAKAAKEMTIVAAKPSSRGRRRSKSESSTSSSSKREKKST